MKRFYTTRESLLFCKVLSPLQPLLLLINDICTCSSYDSAFMCEPFCLFYLAEQGVGPIKRNRSCPGLKCLLIPLLLFPLPGGRFWSRKLVKELGCVTGYISGLPVGFTCIPVFYQSFFKIYLFILIGG